VVQYQAALQLAQTAPQLYDLPYLHRQMLDVLGIKNAAKLVPLPDDQKPRDPITENMDVLKGKPLKAFYFQDHQAHIMVHQAAMQDPKILQLLQQNPNAQAMMAAMQAHIAEHLGFEYKRQMQEQMGIEIPDYEKDDELTVPQGMENQIAQAAAQASQILLQQHQMEAKNAQVQEQLQDPVVQMQMQELAIKQAEQQRKAQKDAQDAALKQEQLEIERQRIASQEEIAGANLAMKHLNDKERLEAEQEREGFRAGMQYIQRRNEPRPQPPTKKGD